jgi:hypothetical protein
MMEAALCGRRAIDGIVIVILVLLFTAAVLLESRARRPR